jgi:hypothetical protein
MRNCLRNVVPVLHSLDRNHTIFTMFRTQSTVPKAMDVFIVYNEITLRFGDSVPLFLSGKLTQNTMVWET